MTAELPTITADQLLSDLDGADFLGQLWGDDTYFSSLGDNTLASVENLSQEPSEEDEGGIDVTYDAIVTNDAYRVDLRLRSTYVPISGGWALQSAHELLGCTLRATAPIELDPQGRFDSSATVTFDEDAQTCRVSGAYEPLWFETVSGDPALLYRFDGSVWEFQGLDPGSATITYEGLAGTYVDPSNPQFEATSALGCQLVIDAVGADGAASGSVTLQSTTVGGAQEPWQATAQLTGQAVGSVTSAGDHRVTVTLTGALDPDATPVALGAVADGSVVAQGPSGRALKVVWPVLYAAREENTTMDALVSEDLSAQLEVVEAAELPTK